MRLAGTAAGFLALATLAAPAAAQMSLGWISLGSPGDPPRVALEGGGFNVKPHNTPVAGEIRGEYRFGDVLWFFSPFLGLAGTSDGAFYGYFGFGFDVNFGPHWVVNPNAAVGYFHRGDGINLGSRIEFRTGAELDYRFANLTRLGLAIHHMSNAGISRHNPGEESVTLVYTVPFR